MTDAMRGDALRDFLSSNVIFSKVLEFLSSKSFGDTESALRKELQELLAKGLTLADLNQFTSELERDLQLPISLPKEISLPDESTSDEHRARGLLALNTSQGPSAECTAEQVASLDRVDALLLFKAVPYVGPLASELRKKRGLGTAREHVIFHELEAMPADEETAIVRLNLPMVFNPNLNGLEDERELHLHGGDIVAGRYRVARKLGTGSFSTSYQCFQVFEGSDARSDGPATGRWVSIKVLRNDKDCYDTGCSEIRMLNSIKTKDPAGVHHLLRLEAFFYWREHLLIVTELLAESLFTCYRRFGDRAEERLRFFNAQTTGALAAQMLDALAFLHALGVAHCDVKAENICLAKGVNRRFKLIDFGSAVLRFDVHNSYVQSRWYRAPEVMLGMPWDTQVDLWSLGCVLAEVQVGQPIFRASSVERVLAAQVAVLGPIPAQMTMFSPQLAGRYLTEEGSVYQVDVEGIARGIYQLQPLPERSLDNIITKATSADLFGGPLDGFVNLLNSLLTFEPKARSTATMALRQSWLVGINADADSADAAPSCGSSVLTDAMSSH